MTTEAGETPGAEVRRRRGELRGPRGREMTQQQLADAADVSVETIGNIESDKSGRASLPQVRATLARLEMERAPVDDVPVPPIVKAALSSGTPDIIRTRQQGGVIEVFMFVRPPGMSQADFDKIVADFDAGR